MNVLATLPDWRRISVLAFGNTALVEFAGIEKLTVRPPVLNCTEGSTAYEEATSRFSVPVKEIGYA